jgi:hypothetical protein
VIEALVLAAVLQATNPPAPTPSTPPKTIIDVRVSPLCSLVHTVVVPFLATERDNHRLFQNMDYNVGKLIHEADGAGSPVQILATANIDWYSSQIYDNLARVDLLLKSSYERTPKGKDPSLDALRSRMQTLVDVERIRNNQYASIAAPRATSYNYWKSMSAEVSQIQRADRPAATPDPPPPERYSGAWFGSEMQTEQHDLVSPVLRALNSCGM